MTALPEPGIKSKRAAIVAERIIEDVIAAGWPVGEIIGSEPELLERYGVSRAVFREAVRLVENQQVARMRRGPGGGLVVTEPTVEAIIDAAVLYLCRVGTRLKDVFEARNVLEDLACQLAPGRCDEADVRAFREILELERTGSSTSHRALHTLIASSTHNRALVLFVEILTRVTSLYFGDAKPQNPEYGEAVYAHQMIVESLLAGDEGLTRHRMRKHLDAEASFIVKRRWARRVLDPSKAVLGGLGEKRGEEVAREVFALIMAENLEPGEMIGSEPALMEHFGVSRAIIREAVRLLEHHQIARMRRGPGGGLFVVAPDVLAVTSVAAIYLERHGITIAEILEVRASVELAVLDLVLAQMSPSIEHHLRDALAREMDAPPEDYTVAAHDLHIQLAALSGNHALELLSGVLIRLTHLHEAGELSNVAVRELGREVDRTHTRIVDAVVGGDRDLSRHRMSRHLAALAGFFR